MVIFLMSKSFQGFFKANVDKERSGVPDSVIATHNKYYLSYHVSTSGSLRGVTSKAAPFRCHITRDMGLQVVRDTSICYTGSKGGLTPESKLAWDDTTSSFSIALSLWLSDNANKTHIKTQVARILNSVLAVSVHIIIQLLSPVPRYDNMQGII